MPTKDQNSKPTPAQTDPRGTRMDGYWGQGINRPGVGKFVQRSGEPQFCGSVSFRVFSYEEGPHKIDPKKLSRRFSGEFMAVTFEGKRIFATEGYVPTKIERSIKAIVDRGEIASWAGDLWCEPAENTPLGYAFTPYDLRKRGENDPLMQLAIEAGIIERLALPAPEPAVADDAEIDPETGEVIERLSDAAQ